MPVARPFGELVALVGENCMDAVGRGVEEPFQELPGRIPVRLLDQLRHCKLARSVTGHKEIELCFLRSQPGNVDMEDADRVASEPLRLGRVAVPIRQP